jgi:stearoyl-CoA desaturase (delta-9 desaturase)
LSAIGYLKFIRCSWPTVALGIAWFVCCGLSITAGYHRLLAHRAYRATAVVRAFFLLFGAASAQNSALRWCAEHRRHHRHTDQPADPYNIRRGFWWAHVGWIIAEEPCESPGNVADLERDRLVAWQHRHYPLLAVAIGIALPACIGSAWGDPLGALLVAGFLRLAVQWHATFCVNSLAHSFGTQPYTTDVSARENLFVSLITFGEGYHNFHHRFPADYRNGVRWYHFDPTKWCVWTMSWLGLTSGLRRTPEAAIRRLAHPISEMLQRGEIARRLP